MGQGGKVGERDGVEGAARRGGGQHTSRTAMFARSRVQIGIKGRARVISLPAVSTGLAASPWEPHSIPRAACTCTR